MTPAIKGSGNWLSLLAGLTQARASAGGPSSGMPWWSVTTVSIPAASSREMRGPSEEPLSAVMISVGRTSSARMRSQSASESP
ncbi:hypothetical protein D3C78_1649520 [compost metagenome]